MMSPWPCCDLWCCKVQQAVQVEREELATRAREGPYESLGRQAVGRSQDRALGSQYDERETHDTESG
jgi:hypothetical protein